MLTGMPIPKDILSTFAPFGPPVLSVHAMPNQTLLAPTQPLTKVFIDAPPYSESATQWLISLLDLFADIVNRNEDLSHLVITEVEYQQLSGILDDLIYSVGDDENHPLSATMTLVGALIKMYEDQHFPKLDSLFPELAEGAAVKIDSENKDATTTISGQIDTDFVIVLFSIGCLLWKGGKSEKAISGYNLAISINPDYASVHTSRGEAKSSLNDFTGAKEDLQRALKLTEKQGEDNFSTAIKERLQEIDVVESAIAYLSESKFSKFSILRECKIQMGTIHSRADIVLCDAEGNFITIVECKLFTGSQHGEYNHEPLKSYLCATDTLFGIFASNINPDSWVFYENLRHNRFRQINRSDFEKRALK